MTLCSHCCFICSTWSNACVCRWDVLGPLLDEKGLSYAVDEDLVLRRQLGADGRSRAFVNDQAASVGVLRDLGAVVEIATGLSATDRVIESPSDGLANGDPVRVAAAAKAAPPPQAGKP